MKALIPFSLPMPESFMPPQAEDGSLRWWSFTQIMPTYIRHKKI
jgi:hypothetical protein